MPQSVGEIVREQEDNFIRGNTQISKYVAFSMHDTLERVEAYANSRHISGEFDSQGREKPFFNIVTAAINIWYRATDIDRKNIKFVPKDNKSVPLAFVANVILQNWMNDNRFGVFLNEWGRSLSKYGSTVIKFVKNKIGLHINVIPWNRLIVDSIDFENNPKIEVLELTEAQLRGRIKTNGYNPEQVEALATALKARETLDKNKKDNKNDFIKLYEVHGNLPLSILKRAQGTEPSEADETTYRQQMHVISFIGATKGNATEYQDFTLFCGEEAEDLYMLTHLIKEDSRSLSIGAVEHLFETQWMTNHSMKTIKDTLDLSSRLFFQTADTHFVGRNVLTNIETGDVLVYGANSPLSKVDTSKADIVSMQNYAVLWKENSQDITATPDALRGNTPVSGTPYSTTSLLAAQSNSLFELMTENKGLAIEDMMVKFIIPYVKSKLKNTDQVAAILDQAGIQEIDTLYIPNQAIKLYNAQATETILNGGVPSPFNQTQATQAVQQQTQAQGDKRYFVPDDASDKTWAEVFSDFEWESIRVEVTNEQVDKQQVLQVLNTVMQTVASNPMILSNPNAMQLFSAILRETGVISPLQLSTAGVVPPLPPTNVRVNEMINYTDLPPDAQQQILSRLGVQIQPPQVGAGGLPTQQ